jgi:hypothetical protein
MAKHLIIGAASNYTWEHLKLWVNSIKMSGFTGDIVIVSNNMSKETIQKLSDEGVELSLYGKPDANGDLVSPPSAAPHVDRFFQLWHFLDSRGLDYDYVITTDTRDVVFQKNPMEFIEENGRRLIASCEMMRYEDEPWNNQNLLEAFGAYFHNKYRGMLINNVGIIAGNPQYVRDLLFLIFQMSINRPIPIVDQVVYNVLLQQKPFSEITYITYNYSAWAVNLGATEEAVKSGKGDLGMMIQRNPDLFEKYRKDYIGPQPILRDDGIVCNSEGNPFVIVHQYDRTLAWKDKIIARYEDQ